MIGIVTSGTASIDAPQSFVAVGGVGLEEQLAETSNNTNESIVIVVGEQRTVIITDPSPMFVPARFVGLDPEGYHFLLWLTIIRSSTVSNLLNLIMSTKKTPTQE